jgi:hypothetical protein
MTKSVQEMIRGESMDVGEKTQSMALGYVDAGACRVPKTKK